MTSISSRWVFSLAPTAAILVTACSLRWGAPAVPSQSLSTHVLSATPNAASSALYVANNRSDSIDVYETGKAEPWRKITNGIASPAVLAANGAGDLFVGNGGRVKTHPSVTVYAPGRDTPKLTITDGMRDFGQMALDPAGNLFYANYWGSEVYEYAAGTTKISRTITDGVVKLQALSVDSSGYLYVSNCQDCLYSNQLNTLTVYKPRRQKPFLTVVRSYAPIGDMAFDPSGNLYVDVGSAIQVYAKHTNRLLRVLPDPGELFIDGSGTLYSAGHRFVNSGGRIVVFAPGASTPSYTISKGLYDPQALAEDPSGNLYVANTLHNTISVYARGSAVPLRAITVATGVDDPQSLAFDASGNLYVANGLESTVTLYAPGSTSVLRTIDDGVLSPTALAFDKSENLYVGNLFGNGGGSVANAYITVYGPGKLQPHLKIAAGIHGPTYSMAFDQAENLYVASGCPAFSDPITVYAPGQRSVLRTVGRSGINPCAIAFDSAGNLYAAVVGLPGQISVFSPDASVPSHVITKGIDYPEGLAFDSAGNLYVTNARGGKLDGKTWGSISVYRPNGKRPLRKIKWGLRNGPSDPVLGPSGDLYVISGNKIIVYPIEGGKPRFIGDQIRAPDSLAFDSSGVLYVANDGNSTVTEYEPGSSKVFRTIPPAKGNPDALIFAPR